MPSAPAWLTPIAEVIPISVPSSSTSAPPLVVLADISGSMSQYTRIFLHFLHALTEKRRRVHTFVFGTRLTNLTRQMRHRDPDDALADCSAAVQDWSGGTRIGDTLHEFNRDCIPNTLGTGLAHTDCRSDPDELSVLVNECSSTRARGDGCVGLQHAVQDRLIAEVDGPRKR